jgi:hypothetical protein
MLELLAALLTAGQVLYPPSFEQCLVSPSSLTSTNQSESNELLVLMTISGDIASKELMEFAKDSQQVACWARQHGYRFATNVIVSQDYEHLHFFSARWQSLLDGECYFRYY